MATAKKTLPQKSMTSKVIDSAKDLFDETVVAVSDAFAGSPARKGPVRATSKPTAKRPAVKKAATRKVAKKMDAKLVSTMEVYEIKYLAQKHQVTQKAVKEAVTKVGHSRNKVEAELKSKKTKAA